MKLRNFKIFIITSLTLCRAICADEPPIFESTSSLEPELVEMKQPPMRVKTLGNRYYSISLSGLTQGLANFEIGTWERMGNNSYVIALKQLYTKGLAGILGSWQYRRHFEPFGSFAFYSGLGIDSGVILAKEVPAFMVVIPTFSIGKIISESEEVTQFLELRSDLPYYYVYVNYPVQGLTYKFNYAVFYGVSY